MRLTPAERDAITTAARAIWGYGVRVSLFGSRTDNAARGGDIDLLVKPPTAPTPVQWVAQRGEFVGRLYASIGERRIDVLLDDEHTGVPSDVILSARRQALPLAAP
ncbi:MAG: nucleotidyltransferase domain-containing protein [Burkholderiales bacterium]